MIDITFKNEQLVVFESVRFYDIDESSKRPLQASLRAKK